MKISVQIKLAHQKARIFIIIYSVSIMVPGIVLDVEYTLKHNNNKNPNFHEAYIPTGGDRLQKNKSLMDWIVSP